MQSDAEAREAIVESLRRKLQGSDKSLVGNKGYRRFLKRRKTTNRAKRLFSTLSS